MINYGKTCGKTYVGLRKKTRHYLIILREVRYDFLLYLL